MRISMHKFMKAPSNLTRNANNFDIIRILFAWLVIISHSYILSGSKHCDWVCESTNHYINMSYFGVKGFITISGFLIFKSLQRSPNVLDYLWKRVLRIYPGLLLVLFITTLMAYLIYKPGNAYFNFNTEAIQYILNNLSLYHNQWRIHGVFDNNSNTAINGSLWTMGFEFFFYLVLLCLFPIRKYSNLILILLAIVIMAGLYGNLYYIDEIRGIDFQLRVDFIFELGVFFLTGAFWGVLDWKSIANKNVLFGFAIVQMAVVIYSKANPIWLCLSLPFIVLHIGQQSSRFANWIHENIEDPSYGIYLYAFPVQQLIVYLFHPSVFVLLWTSTIVSFTLGIASWKLVEKKMLRFKNLFAFRTQ